uniref:Putative microplusin n=1 Tax=Rhipicephalus microplus TaxID=6941 RepID=A0A6G4ZW33_RHIMP
MKPVLAICFLRGHLRDCVFGPLISNFAGKPYWQLVKELNCITSRISRRTLQAFSHAVWELHCPNYACAIRRMCSYNDLEGAMSYFFNWFQIQHFHRVAHFCSRRTQEVWWPKWWQSTFPSYGERRMFL